MIPLLPRKSITRIGGAVEWVERYGNMLIPPDTVPHDGPMQTPYPVRGILLQNIYGGGSGYAELVYKATHPYSIKVDIVGVNPINDSSFRLAFSGVDDSNNARPLFETESISSVSTADEVRTAVLLAGQAAALPLNRESVQVTLGNPMSVPADAAQDIEQPELDKTDAEDVQAYVGSWIVTFLGNFPRNYRAISCEIIQDSDSFMRGLSSVISRPTYDVPSGSKTIFHDVLNRPFDYPWKVGTLAVAVYFVGLGMGIIGSNFRDLTSQPVAEQ